MMEFQNKTAVITGGASGIGFLSAKCFAQEGANVLLVDVNEKALIEKSACRYRQTQLPECFWTNCNTPESYQSIFNG